MSVSAELLKLDPNIITNAFITKTIFTLVDERIKKETTPDENLNEQSNKK
jgi:hypothetical protein